MTQPLALPHTTLKSFTNTKLPPMKRFDNTYSWHSEDNGQPWQTWPWNTQNYYGKQSPNSKNPPRMPTPSPDTEELPAKTLERACHHILDRAYKPANRLLQHSALMPATQQTAEAVEALSITEERELLANKQPLAVSLPP